MHRLFGKSEKEIEEEEKARKRSQSVEEMGGDLLDKTINRIPEKYKESAAMVKPAILAVLKLVDLIIPYLPQLWILCKQAYAAVLPFWDELSVIWGIILTFFGGSFMLTVTTIEAFRLVGNEKIVTAWKKIEDDVLRLVKEYNEQNTGTESLTPDKWVQKNGNIVLREVNPDDCRDALVGFYAGFGAVIACLRNQFAQVIALGVSFGGVLENHFGVSHVIPFIKALVPEEHWKWVPFLSQIVFRLPTTIIVWCLQRIISAFYSAMRGADILSNACLNFLHKRAIVKEEPNHKVRAFVSAVFTVLGLSFQLSYGFGLPWFLSVPLLPFTLIEYVLGFLSLGL